jgi:hypothetical protein
LAVEPIVIDRFAAASKLRPDGVLGFHSALELHGIAYSEFNEAQLISAGRTERVDLPFGACRFVTPPKALAAAGRAELPDHDDGSAGGSRPCDHSRTHGR